MTPQDILAFWYSDSMKKGWFNSTPELDQQIYDQYDQLWHDAKQGKYKDWEQTPEGCLALIIVFDQFPLNMYRGKEQGFQTENEAVRICKHAIKHEFDKQLTKDKLAFLYMPLMHSENLRDQDLSVQKFDEAGLEENAKFARHHREIVQQYGRFPHRNKILDRESTTAELNYLNSDKAFKG